MMRLKKHTGMIIAVLLLFTIACNNSPKLKTVEGAPALKLIAEGLTGPVDMECPKDGSGRLFICEQSGKIKIIKDGKVLPEPFLDINHQLTELNRNYSEKGLLGLAFHPHYKTNGRFFVYYSATDSNKIFDHKSIIAEYKVSANPDKADASSVKIIMEIEQPEQNHNGGQLAFGPDSMLYIGSGDGGGANDQHGVAGNGQNMNTLLGKILRIDVDQNYPYAIPSDNPFVNNKNTRPEIWAYGLRNPWRFSFDRENGKLFCGDVGQNEWEEIDIIQKGRNYGWRIMEGNHCFNPDKDCKQQNLELPIADYQHKTGICVIGGYVYRGEKVHSLQGKYIFADWNGRLFCLEEKASKWEMMNLNISDRNDNDLKGNINSFGEDENGKLYILSQKTVGPYETGGSVYMILNEK